MTNDVSCQVQAGRACAAVVVHVVDWDLRHAELVKDTLPARRVAVTVAGDALVDIVIVDLRVQHRFDARFETKFGVVDFPAGFDEFGHAYAEDVAWFVAFDDHFGGVLM